MASRLVTCPESAHLERIDYVETPCGMLVLACSRFDPPCEPACPRTCAARLDQRERLDLDVDDDDFEDDVLAVGDDTSLDVLGSPG